MPEKAGLINRYTCPKGHSIVTVNRDDGTTPLLIRCREEGCNEMAKSEWYDVDPTLKPTYEWFKPNAGEMAALESASLHQHARMGGLILRKIE